MCLTLWILCPSTVTSLWHLLGAAKLIALGMPTAAVLVLTVVEHSLMRNLGLECAVLLVENLMLVIVVCVTCMLVIVCLTILGCESSSPRRWRTGSEVTKMRIWGPLVFVSVLTVVWTLVLR